MLSPNIIIAQIVPSFQGIYDKKSTSFSTSSSLTFDGSNDKVTTNGTLDNLGGFTLELWLYPHSASGSMAIIGENNLIEFGYGSATSLRIWTNSGATNHGLLILPPFHLTHGIMLQLLETQQLLLI